MNKEKQSCFVCDELLSIEEIKFNSTVNLPVCNHCKNTEKEKQKEAEYLESLAEGFVCGCI